MDMLAVHVINDAPLGTMSLARDHNDYSILQYHKMSYADFLIRGTQ